MFANQRPTLNQRTVPDPKIVHQYTIADHHYGKHDVKLVHIKRDGPFHTMKEFEVATRLKLSSTKEYLRGDNSDIIGTDAQRNSVYLLAKKYGIENSEKFALTLAQHFLDKYSHIEEVRIDVEEYPWQRICQELSEETNDKTSSLINNSQKHNHAFIFTPTQIHFCNVVLRRTDPKQTVVCGIKGMRVLKTAQSKFVNYIKDEYREVPDQYDRLFSTILNCSWEYSDINNVKFSEDWNTVKNIFVRKFAGDPTVGTTSLCLQNVLYITGKEVLDVLPHVSVISMTLPNKQFADFDTKPFQTIVPGENNEVFISADKPDSVVHLTLTRKDVTSNL